MVFLGFVSLSCEKAVNDIPISTEPAVAQFKTSGPIKTKISCSGSCDCHLEGVISMPGGSDDDYTQCSCSDCEMLVEQTWENGTVQSTTLTGSEMKIDFISDYMAYTSANHPDQNVKLNAITIETDNVHGSSYLYEYSINGNDYSVMYVSLIQGNVKKKFEIDCTGSCDCKERYVWADPPYSECSCSECTMTVTELPTSPE